MEDLSAAIRGYADGFFSPSVARHTPADARSADEFYKSSGAPASAAELLWSYAAALMAFHARKGGSGGA